jgi:ubiquinone biosynthesis protein COQ9
MTISAQQEALLRATLRQVPFDGWSAAALRHAAAELQLPPGTAECLFPRGIPDVLQYLEHWTDQQMQAGWSAAGTGVLKVHEKIALAVRLRLTALAPYREALRRLPGYYMAHAAGGDSASAVWRAADQIWRLAGDTATDFNYYTKRALLSGVYSATFVYFLRDESPNHADTWAFLMRRLKDVLRLGRLTQPVKNAASGAGSLAAQALSVLRPR